MNETRVKELFAQAVATPAADQLDVDAAVTGGRRRHRIRNAATVGAVLGVVALAVAAAVVALPDAHAPAVDAPTATAAPVRGVDDLTGRWRAVAIKGGDVSSTAPATVIFGSSGRADSWQLHTACAAPEPSGRLEAGPDGQFRAIATVGGTVHCPMLLAGPPDILGALTDARYAVTSGAGGAAATLTLLGADRAVLLELRSSPITTCRDVALTVTFDGSELRAKNGTLQPCRLSGGSAVSVPWWRIDGTPPVPPVGILLPGDTLVQAYGDGPSNGCPIAGPEQATDLVVSVDGRRYTVTMPGRQAYQLQACDAATALPPTITPGPNSPAA